MAKEYIKLSHKELDRVEVIRSVIRKQRCLPAAGRMRWTPLVARRLKRQNEVFN